MPNTRKRLTIQEKISIVDYADKEKANARVLSEKFGIGKTQANDILKQKDELLKIWRENGNIKAKNKFQRMDRYTLDRTVLDWVGKMRKNNNSISGPMLKQKALEVANELKMDNFRASNGWLEKFRLRHNISFKTIYSKVKTDNKKELNSWRKKLVKIIEGYGETSIYNLDETGLLFRALPCETFCSNSENCSGNKSSKESLTILLCCNMAGEFETPLVIGKTPNPKCFNNINVENLPVEWKSNSKSWMTQEIMKDWLLAFDQRMEEKKKNVLLFLDNAAPHPHLVFKNVKLVFLPLNLTSLYQPLNQGIIHNFKVHYRTLFLRHLLVKMDAPRYENELSNSISLLDAVYWISESIKMVNPETCKNCFNKAGINFTPKSEPTEEMIVDVEVAEMVGQLVGDSLGITFSEYVSIDSVVVTHEEELKNDVDTGVDDIEEQGEEDEFPSPEATTSAVTDFSSAIKTIEDLRLFFIENNCQKALQMISALRTEVERETFTRIASA